MERYNPWWRNEPDRAYESWERLNVRWTPREAKSISLEPFSLNFLYGPRQVGKTTMTKLLINHLLEKRGADAYSIFYLSCDELADYRELGEVLDSYLRAKESRRIRTSYVFLDEVTFVREWWRALKVRIDAGLLSHDVVTVTGSASLNLLREVENFPGRRGRGSDVVLRPLSFRSYVEALSGIRPVEIRRLTSPAGAMAANAMHAESLGKLFLRYLRTGGFPLPIKEEREEGGISEGSRKALKDGLRGDWLRAGRSERFMKEVIGYVASARGTPISWLGISKATSIGSPHTSRSYVETLADLLLVSELELMGPDGRVMHRKNRKVHFADPFVYETLSDYAGVAADEAAVVEATVATHLGRRDAVYYWRNGSEVDVVAIEPKASRSLQCGFEVKWGFKRGARPRHLKYFTSLDRKTVPLFLASLPS